MSKLVIISVSIFISVIISVFLISKKKQTIEKNEVNTSKNIEPKLELDEPEPEVMIKVPESPPEVPTVSSNVIAPIVKDEEIVPEVLQKIPEDLVFVQEEIKHIPSVVIKTEKKPLIFTPFSLKHKSCLLYTSPSPRDRG